MNADNGTTTTPTAPPPAPGANGAPALALTPLLVNLRQAAEVLGISAKTVKRMAAAGELPGVVKLRRRTLVNYEALRKWTAAGCPPLPGPASSRRRSGSHP
jgi:excisionase family DNA binding protein